MKRVLAAIALAALLAPGLAANAVAEESAAMKAEREAAKRRSDDADRAYRAALKNTNRGDPSVKVDPWSNARDTTPAAATNASGKPK